MRILRATSIAVLLVGAATWNSATSETETVGLSLSTADLGKAYLSYKGRPLFAFGPGDEMRLVNGAADLERWADWQQASGMNLLRAYPMSVPLERYGDPGKNPFLLRDGKWDVDAFDDAYFEHLGRAAAALEARDIILHLQLWQIVFFKGGELRWDANYLNPANNNNEWTRALTKGRDYIDAPADSPARAHQQRWVRRLLDAMKGRGNVIIDVINELGNEMGSLDWAVEVTRWIRAWEAENNWTFIIGVDSEHHYTPEHFGAQREHFDVVILNELRSWENGRKVAAAFNKPVVSVRSSDGRNQWEDYLFARPDQTGPEHQTRYRTLCYRSLFAGLQSVGAYWKAMTRDADYRDMALWPEYARALRAFWDRIAPHWPTLTSESGETLAIKTIAPHAYALVSPAMLLVYLDPGSHTWNNAFPASTLRVRCNFETWTASHFNPQNGDLAPLETAREGDMLVASLPAYIDDAVVIIENGAVSSRSCNETL